MRNLTFQYDLRPELPNIYGHCDYEQFRITLMKMDEILTQSGLENQLVDSALNQWIIDNQRDQDFCNSKSHAYHWKNLRHALRCNIARHLTGESFRNFSVRLVDSALLQWFVGIHGFAKRMATSKSSMDRYSKCFNESLIAEKLHQFQSGFLSNQPSAESIGLNDAMDCSVLFMDNTCVKANIHFPVDWVLLRDAVRSLLSAIKTIRAQGLKHRMIEPALLMKRMNKLCISMTHTRRRNDGKKQRKKILRDMKTLSQCIQKHAKRYRELLIKNREKTEWTEKQAAQVIGRIDNILNQLPDAIEQAHERIIGERQVPSDQKILSLYDHSAYVMVRGKSGNEVEFGQSLLLTEQVNGLIVDWKLFENQPLADSRLLNDTTARIQKNYGKIKSICGDRAFSSKANSEMLQGKNIFDATCPRSPKQLEERMNDPIFAQLQARRSQTEARIGIFKNVFLGKPLKNKSFMSKQMAVGWCVITHNLWVIARKALADELSRQKAA